LNVRYRLETGTALGVVEGGALIVTLSPNFIEAQMFDHWINNGVGAHEFTFGGLKDFRILGGASRIVLRGAGIRDLDSGDSDEHFWR